MAAAQHQHYVPQLLLRGFLSRNEKLAAKQQVHVFDLETGRVFTPPVDKIMGERRFNDFWMDDETLATVEPAAGRIETHVAPVVERIRHSKCLERTHEERSELSLLLAFQFIRTKRMRLMPLSLDRQLREKIAGMGMNPSKVRGLEDWTEVKLKLQHVHHQIDGLKKYTGLMAEKEFFLMTAPEDSSFYLGDHPVVMHNDDERRGMFGGGLGLAVPYIQIYLPLSADVLLCAYDPAVLGQMMKNRDELVTSMQLEALGLLRQGRITAAQMKAALEGLPEHDEVKPLIETIRAGRPVSIGREQVQFYNSLQAAHAHRFVVDPDGRFEVAAEIAKDRPKHADEIELF